MTRKPGHADGIARQWERFKNSMVTDSWLIVLYALLLTAIALSVYPVWDDGWLQLLRAEGVSAYHDWRVRPMELYILDGVVRRGWLLALGILTHLIGWCALGMTAYHLWRLLFPDRENHAVLAAVICMAPLLTTIQLNLIIVPASVMLSSVLVFAAMFLLVYSGNKCRLTYRVFTIAAFGLLLTGCLLSEYAVPTGLACVVLMSAVLKPMPVSKKSWRLTIAAFFGLLVAGYAAYWVLSSGIERYGVRPEQQWQSQGLAYGLGVMVVRLGTSIWQGAIGYLLSEIGALSIHHSPVQALALVPGLLAGWGLSHRIYRVGADTDLRMAPARRCALPALTGALCLGLMPIVFMRQLSHPNRFWLPLLPVTACLSLRLLQYVLRQRWRKWIPWMFGVLIIQSTLLLQHESMDDVRTVRGWGQEIRGYLAEEGLTVAVLMTPEAVRQRIPTDGFHTRLLDKGEDYWLTAVLAREWLPDEIKMFWAFGSWGQAQEFLAGIIPGSPVERPVIERRVRGVIRHGPIKRILWLYPDHAAHLRIIVQDVSADHVKETRKTPGNDE